MPKSVETASDRFVLHEGHLRRLLVFLQEAEAFAPVRTTANLSLSLVGALELIKDGESERETFAVMTEN